jgi:hypothetical protein
MVDITTAIGDDDTSSAAALAKSLQYLSQPRGEGWEGKGR